MKIGEVSERSGISVRMLRYYENAGLLRPQRRESRYRDYSAEDLAVAKRIRQLADAGLTIEAMHDLLPCVISPEPRFHPCENLRARLANELQKLDHKLSEIERSRHMIAKYLEGLDRPSPAMNA